MIKVDTANDERKIKICFHNTFLFSPRVYKDRMNSNSFDEYLFFCENLRTYQFTLPNLILGEGGGGGV